MNTLFLKYALEINKTGSITKAADNLYMQQPNLSKAMKELEDSLGYQIFERTGRGMLPTAQGERFLDYARDILDKLNELQRLSEENPENSNRFQISIPRGSYIANGFTEFVLGRAGDTEINFSICETNSMQAIDNIVERGFHLGIIRYAKKDERYFLDYLKSRKLEHEEVWEFRFVIAMSQEGVLAEKKMIHPDDLEQLIQLRHGDVTVPLYDPDNAIFHKKNLPAKKINVFERGSQFDLLSRVKNTYMWVSPLPESYLTRNRLVQRKCCREDGSDASEVYKDVLIYRKGYEFNQLDREFIKKLYDSKAGVAERIYY